MRTLGHSARARLRDDDIAILSRHGALLPPAPSEDDLLLAARELAALPLLAWETLRGFASESNDYGALLVGCVPIDETAGDRKDGRVSELCLLAAAHCLGTPVGYATQRGGSLVQDLRPRREDARKQLGTNSVELVWHTEEAHTEHAPRYVLLLCIRGDTDAGTLVSRVEPAMLDEIVRTRLSRPDFRIGSDVSHEAGMSRLCPVLGVDRLVFDPLYTECADDRALAALAALADHVDERATQVSLRAGELLIIDNFRAAHARTAYTPRYDGTDRWLQRAVVMEQAPPPRAVACGRTNVIRL